MHRKQAEKGIYSDHRILVFASLSLGEQGLDDVLTAVSGQPDSVIVFRGIPEGMNLGQGVKAIQALAAKKTQCRTSSSTLRCSKRTTSQPFPRL